MDKLDAERRKRSRDGYGGTAAYTSVTYEPAGDRERGETSLFATRGQSAVARMLTLGLHGRQSMILLRRKEAGQNMAC